MLLFIGSFVAFFGTGIMPVCKVYIAEQYPTELRGVGTGFGAAVSRVVGGVLAAYYLLIWGQETARRSVEDSSAAPQMYPLRPGTFPLGPGRRQGRFFHVRYAVFHHHHTGRSRVARGGIDLGGARQARP